jgi:hypothetical protein
MRICDCGFDAISTIESKIIRNLISLPRRQAGEIRNNVTTNLRLKRYLGTRNISRY